MTVERENIEKNVGHYDEAYQKVDLEKIIDHVNNFEKFLLTAIPKDTSWHGLYANDFRNVVRGKKVLELGCGDGLNALIMAKLGADVIANDISSQSEVIISEIAKRLQLPNIKAISGDLREIDFPENEFDFVIGKAFIHHLTHDLEEQYLQIITRILKRDGEARFFEPAVNNKLVDEIRLLVPVPGRPSKLNKKAFEEYKRNDPHPVRDNSSDHYRRVGDKYFYSTEIIFIGTLERFCRMMPEGNFRADYRRWAHRVEPRLPGMIRKLAARSQTIIYKNPK